MRLLDPRQAEIPGVGSVAVDGAGTTASVPLPTLTPGTYTVSYQVTSAVDGHVTSGIFAFLVDPTGTEPAPSAPTEASSLSSGPEVVAARWAGLAGALALFGIPLFWLVSARPALLAAEPALVRAPWGALAIAAAATLAGLALYLALAARPIIASGGHLAHGEGFPLDLAAPFGWTPFAIAMRVALLGALAAFLLAAAHWTSHDEAQRRGRPPDASPERGWLLLALAAATLTLAGSSMAGHAAAIGGPLSGALDLAHLAAVGAWLGTLPGLFLLVRRHRAAVGAALRIHSRVALVAAPIVVLTGLANSPVVLGDASRELVASDYGNLLISKALLFSVAVAIGAANFFLVRSRSLGRAMPLIGAELLVGTVAVLAAAGMVTGQPSANRVPVLTSSAIGTAHLYGTAGESSVHAAISLPAPGSQRYQVAVADASTGAYRTDVQRVILVFTPPPDSGLAAERVELEPGTEPGLWGTAGAYTPVVGSWQLEVIVRREGLRDEATAFGLPVTLPLPPQAVPPPDIGAGVPLALAALWSLSPPGPAAWGIPLGLRGLVVAVSLVARRRHVPILGWLRAGLVVLALVAGLGAGSRAAVQAANLAPADAAAMPNPIPADAASVGRGRGLFLANCAVCHGSDGEGDGVLAPEVLPMRPLAEAVPGLSDGSLAYRIAVGTAGTRMPAFATSLSENDRWDLVNYLRSRWARSGP